MSLAGWLRKSELNAKKLSSLLADKISEDRGLLDDLREEADLLTDVEKGIVMEALEYATDTNPELVEPVVDIVVEWLKCEAPKVKWEAARVIGNIAHRFPEKASGSVPRLLENSRHKGTVVRWSSAYALSKIIEHDAKERRKLLPEIEAILKREKNNGVRNVYLKTLKKID